MKLRKLLSLSIAAILLCFTGCVNKNTLSKHEPITILAPYLECDRLVDLVHKKYPEINLKVLSYSGANTTTYLQNMLAADDLPDICTQTIYDPNIDDVSDTKKMMDCMDYIQKWKDLGMFTANKKNPQSDDETIKEFMKGNTLFLLGSKNGIGETDGTKDKFGLMPYLSEDGSQNVYILNVTRFHGLSKKLEKDPQKLKDALKVMKVISSVEGTSALYEEATLKANLLPFKDWNADNTYYGDIADEINAGNTAPLIYVGWENTLVNTGYRMLEYIQDKATIKDVVDQLDKDQDRVVNNKPEVITTTTEVISQKSCAKLIGRCFMEATKSDAALISLGKWIKGNGKEQNMAGVNGKLYAQDITESDICSILPTGWYDTIQTVQLSGREIKQLCKDGYDAAGTGNTYPYVLVKDKKLEADQTYKVVICGAGKELTLNDSGIVGMNAAKDFFSKFKTLSEADVK